MVGKSGWLILICLLLASISMAKPAMSVQDTVFLKHRSKNDHSAVFIDTSSSTSYYSRFGFFVPDSTVLSQDRHSDSVLQAGSTLHFPDQLREFIGEWVDVHRYRNKYYLYYPCDGMNQWRMILSDSAIFYFNGGDSYSLFPIIKVSVKRHEIQLRLRAPLSDTGGTKLLTIRILEESKPNQPVKFEGYQRNLQYMIPVEMVRRYPIIVNDCPDQKESEVEFDGKGGIRIR
jgi:hypothetical protein